jgi:hypothetical protein
MQFRTVPMVQVSAACPAQRPPRSDRDLPLRTARDRCLWHAGGTAGDNDDARTWRRRLQLGQRVRPVLGDPPPRGSSLPRRLAPAAAYTRQPQCPAPWWKWGDSNSTAAASTARGQEAVGGATCGFTERRVSAPDRCCPPFTYRLRTQHGPRGVPGPIWSRTTQALLSSAARDRSAGRAWQGP